MTSRKIVIVSMFALTGVLGGCDSGDVDTEATRGTIEQVGSEVQEAARNAMASLRTDIERFTDDIQTRNAPEAKKQLLDRCRDTLERLRKANSDSADRVSGICDRIEDTDVKDSSAWEEIKREVEQIA